MKFLLNPELPLVRPEWPGNPHNGQSFLYPDRPFSPSFRKLLQWQLSPNPQREEKKADDWRPEVHSDRSYLQQRRDFISWLGHATFLIQLNGVRLITDPVFSNLPFLPRLVQLPFPLQEIRDLDYILLSHDHRDHCDRASLTTLLQHNQPKKILAPLHLSRVIRPWVKSTIIEEAAWYQRYQTAAEAPEIIFLPSRHWSRRGLSDFNRVLWGSFLIRWQGTTIYFGADSGAGDHFAEIGRLFPDIDYAMIGIGAYSPDYMMSEIHTSPAEALEAFDQLGAKKLIPMHYGTYDLSDEPIGEPCRLIRSGFEETGRRDQLEVLGVNEVLYLDK